MSTKFENTENETFLSDWMAGKMTDDQLRQRVSEADFDAFQKLKLSLQNYQVASPDMEKNYAAITSKLEAKKKPKSSKIIPLVTYAMIAASLVLLFGLYHVFVFSNTLQTDYGNTEVMTMNEGSRVTLNAKSKVSFPTFFKYNRTLKLEGEAFFEVTKGSPFTVATSLGKVQVLGTKFNVIAREDFFEVICYEGKVKVCSPTQSKIITLGQAIRFYQKQCETWDENETSKPLWMSGESSFKSVPLQYVVDQFQNQYHLNVTYPEALKSIKFSGSFTHKNKDTALESICIPLHLHYIQTSTSKILISE